MTPEERKIVENGGVPAGSLVVYRNRIPNGNRREITVARDLIDARQIEEVIRYGPAEDAEDESIEPETEVNGDDTGGLDGVEASAAGENVHTDQQEESSGTAQEQLAEAEEGAGEATVDAFNGHDSLTKTCFYCYKARSGCDRKTRRPCSRCLQESRTAAECVNHDEHSDYAEAKRDNRLKELKDFNKWPTQYPK